MIDKNITTEEMINCVQIALCVMGGKWRLPILIAISQGNNRFRDIQRSVSPITTRVLSKELKDLEENKLVLRTVYDTSPVTVEYTITPYCKTLAPLMDELIVWGKNHEKKSRTGKSK